LQVSSAKKKGWRGGGGILGKLARKTEGEIIREQKQRSAGKKRKFGNERVDL